MTEPMRALVAGLDPSVPRGGLTADQVAELALRCGRAETALRAMEAQAVETSKILDDARWEIEILNDRVEILTGALERCRHGYPWVLRSVGL